MSRTQTIVQLSDDLVAALDAEGSRRGMSRSAVIREAIVEHIASDREAAIDRVIVEGYTRIPAGTPDEWGDLEAFAEASALETARRLDEEEHETGYGPW